MTDRIQHKYVSNITCPYCGYEDQDSWETTDDCGECECSLCEKKFYFSRDVTIEYTTKQLCEENGGQHVWGEPNTPHLSCYRPEWIAGRFCKVCEKCQLVEVDQETKEVVYENGEVVVKG